MALASNQTVKIIVTLDANAAKNQLVRAQEQAGKAVQRRASAGGSGIKPGMFTRGLKTGRGGGGGVLGKTVRSGLGRLAGKALRGAGGGLLSKATRMGGGLLARAGVGVGATATAASVAVIGIAIKAYLDNAFPNLGENLRRLVAMDKIVAAFEQASKSASKFKEFDAAFADLGISLPGSFGLSAAINKVEGFKIDIEAQRDATKRRNQKAADSSVGLDEMTRRGILGTTAGQILNRAPDMRAALLKMIGMKS